MARKKCLQAAREAVDEDSFDFNFSSFQFPAKDDDFEEIMNAASTSSLFPSVKIVLIKAMGLSKAPAKASEALADWIAKPLTDATIVLQMESPDERQKLHKAAKAAERLVLCPLPEKRQLHAWVRAVFKSYSLNIDESLARQIIARAGDDPEVLVGEAEKLSLYPGPGQPLTPELIKELIALGPSSEIYEVSEPLAGGDLAKALPTLLSLLSENDPRPVLSALGTYYRRLLKVKVYFEAARTHPRNLGAAAAELGLNPFYLEKLKARSATFTLEELREALEKMERAYRAFVTTSVPPQITLEELAVSLGL